MLFCWININYLRIRNVSVKIDKFLFPPNISGVNLLQAGIIPFCKIGSR